MKKTKIIYWILTGLFAAFMLFSAIPDIICSKEAVDFMTQLQYPMYFLPFIGVAKVLGVIAILIPGYPRITEWAYAGLFFDLIGAIYSIACVMGAAAALPILVAVAVGIGSYIYYHKKLRESSLK
ncbi:MAG: DoxX-like family protein [Bacteroidetes bacterium]|nr:DoxX-like family protein [Bacteroidota bacterium]